MAAEEWIFVSVSAVVIGLIFFKPLRRIPQRLFDELMLERALRDGTLSRRDEALAREALRMMRSGRVDMMRVLKDERAIALGLAEVIERGVPVPGQEENHRLVRKYQALVDISEKVEEQAQEEPEESTRPEWLIKEFDFELPEEPEVDWHVYNTPTYLRSRHKH